MGDRNITSQADVEALPGSTAFAISGDLLLQGVAEAGLSGLDSLLQVDGNLTIRDNHGLLQVPFDGLQHVTGDINLSDNPLLHTEDAFPSLARVDGSITLAAGAPGDVDGFNLLDELAGDLRISEYAGLHSVSGFRRLIRIGGSLRSGAITVRHCACPDCVGSLVWRVGCRWPTTSSIRWKDPPDC